MKIDDSFVTGQWQVFPWMILPTNCFQSKDLILLCHQFRRYVEHAFKCEMCNIHNGILIVLEILTHECRWFHHYSDKHSPNYILHLLQRWKFFSISFALDHPPDSRMILIPLTNLILFPTLCKYIHKLIFSGSLRLLSRRSTNKKKLSVSCLNSDLQISIHYWW